MISSPVVELFVALASVSSPPGQEREVADRVIAYARELGLAVHEDDAADRLGGTAGNIVVRLEPNADGLPLFFCAHLDTVPERGAIRPVVIDGVIRSVGDTILGADNKAAVAVMLDAMRVIVEERRSHAGIELLFTPMEEVGCRGAEAFDTGRLRAQRGFVYDYADTIGAYVRSAPAGYLLQVEFRGRAAHAGIAPEEGRSAVHAAARAVAGLRTGRVDGDATVNVGTIHGGTAHNVVPERCAISIDVRARADEHARRLVEEITGTCRRAAEQAGCVADVERHRKYLDYRFGENDVVVRLAERALSNAGRNPRPVDGGGGADASIFNARGLECLNLANGMARIHSADEHISSRDLEDMVQVTLGLTTVAQGLANVT